MVRKTTYRLWLIYDVVVSAAANDGDDDDEDDVFFIMFLLPTPVITIVNDERW